MYICAMKIKVWHIAYIYLCVFLEWFLDLKDTSFNYFVRDMKFKCLWMCELRIDFGRALCVLPHMKNRRWVYVQTSYIQSSKHIVG